MSRRSFIVLEDHPLVLEAITDQLTTAFPGATMAYRGSRVSEAVRVGDAHAVTCAILDLDLGDGHAPAENVGQLISAGIPVILLSAHEQPLATQEAVSAGASAYVPKRSLAEQLAAAVGAVETGSTWMSQDFAAVLVPSEGSTVSLDPLAERALVLFAAGLPEPMIAGRMGAQSSEIRPLLESAVRAYRSPAP